MIETRRRVTANVDFADGDVFDTFHFKTCPVQVEHRTIPGFRQLSGRLTRQIPEDIHDTVMNPSPTLRRRKDQGSVSFHHGFSLRHIAACGRSVNVLQGRQVEARHGVVECSFQAVTFVTAQLQIMDVLARQTHFGHRDLESLV